MRKLIATAVAGGLLTAGAWLIPAHANDARACEEGDTVTQPIDTPALNGQICAGGSAQAGKGHVWADGHSENPGPLAGYVSAGNDGTVDEGICADDNGAPGDSESATCVPPSL